MSLKQSQSVENLTVNTLEPEILFARKGGLAIVTLNRPKALNALNLEMCIAFGTKLFEWEKDANVQAVLIRGAGSRAFCAGGDIRRLYEEGRTGGRYPYDFYHDEYVINAHIKRYTKPYIALMDGIVMGGGLGFSVHGARRVLTETTVAAMPETGIGLFPDVGGGYFLSHCPGELGMYLALTGARVKTADAIYCGIGDIVVPQAKLNDLIEALGRADLHGGVLVIDSVLAQFKINPGTSGLMEHRSVIDRHFSKPSVEAILQSLETDSSPFAQETAKHMRTKSPTSCKVTFQQVRLGKTLSMDENMRMEWRIASRMPKGHDFYEGVRALIVDKDNKPAWKPARLEDVTAAEVEAYFRPLGEGELTFPWEKS